MDVSCSSFHHTDCVLASSDHLTAGTSVHLQAIAARVRREWTKQEMVLCMYHSCQNRLNVITPLQELMCHSCVWCRPDCGK